MNRLFLFPLVFLMLACAGCASSGATGAEVRQLKQGMSRAEVSQIMKDPGRTRYLFLQKGVPVRLVVYRSTTGDSLDLMFREGMLVGAKMETYEEAMKRIVSSAPPRTLEEDLQRKESRLADCSDLASTPLAWHAKGSDSLWDDADPSDPFLPQCVSLCTPCFIPCAMAIRVGEIPKSSIEGIEIGMTKAEVRHALGIPDQETQKLDDGAWREEQWHYGRKGNSCQIGFREERVVWVITMRQAVLWHHGFGFYIPKM